MDSYIWLHRDYKQIIMNTILKGLHLNWSIFYFLTEFKEEGIIWAMIIPIPERKSHENG